MTHLTGRERARYVQQMFSRIAPRYDLMNRLMTAGQDVRWRREVIRRAKLEAGQRLLDLGTGTGDLAGEALQQAPDCQVVAADFTLEMMRYGQARHLPGQPAPGWSGADALHLPFAEGCFDAVVSGYLLRNVIDVPGALAEQRRVLKPGGRMVTLDTTPPPSNLLSPLINFHLHTIIPALGRWLSADGSAYDYLPNSTEAFLSAEALAECLAQAGFKEVGFKRLMAGTMAVHWGVK
ncbi:MAG TPA: ubiquinone/menaquinone biosynthesis methyltransferase [Anaerolineales bacterium]|nr:ubiquinone/menaquinone biosynthesis methyltransferase [Anaerolineales bacterium]